MKSRQGSGACIGYVVKDIEKFILYQKTRPRCAELSVQRS